MNNAPKISSNFTVDDIHVIREWNYERRKNMTQREIIEDINRGALKSIERINRLRKNRAGK